MGFKASNEGYPVEPSSLRGEDKDAFDLGYSTGKLCNDMERAGMTELNNYQKQMRLIRNE